MTRLAEIAARARASHDYNELLEAIPYTRFLGVRALMIDGRLRLHVPFAPQLIGNRALPSLHGGVAGAVLETVALLTLVHQHEGPPMPRTIDFTVDYLRAARPEDLYAEAEVTRAGRRVANVRMRAFQGEPGETVALGRGNFLLG